MTTQLKLLLFKKQMDSITHDDIQAVRDRKAKHALDLDTLEMPLKLGDEYETVMREFMDSLNFSNDRIEAVECRSRDGFIPYRHNNGGIEALAYRDQYSCCQDTGFDKTDEVLVKYAQYNVDAFKEDHPHLKDVNYSDWSSEDQEALQEYESEGDDTVQFQARIVFTSATTANVDFYVSASDSPYHRTSDDKLELEIEFKSPKGMKLKLQTILKHAFVQRLKRNVMEGF